MNPLQLRETTMDPNTRRLVQLTIGNADATAEMMDMLLGKKRADDRRSWLQTNGDMAEINGCLTSTYDGALNLIADRKFTEDAYLNYSMYADHGSLHYLISVMAWSQYSDIIYAMSQVRCTILHRNIKNQLITVGDVLGKYHPHGDSACCKLYGDDGEAILLPLPLVDGQGNWVHRMILNHSLR